MDIRNGHISPYIQVECFLLSICLPLFSFFPFLTYHLFLSFFLCLPLSLSVYLSLSSFFSFSLSLFHTSRHTHSFSDSILYVLLNPTPPPPPSWWKSYNYYILFKAFASVLAKLICISFYSVNNLLFLAFYLFASFSFHSSSILLSFSPAKLF